MQDSRREARKSFFAEFVDLAFGDQVFHGTAPIHPAHSPYALGQDLVLLDSAPLLP